MWDASQVSYCYLMECVHHTWARFLWHLAIERSNLPGCKRTSAEKRAISLSVSCNSAKLLAKSYTSLISSFSVPSAVGVVDWRWSEIWEVSSFESNGWVGFVKIRRRLRNKNERLRLRYIDYAFIRRYITAHELAHSFTHLLVIKQTN